MKNKKKWIDPELNTFADASESGGRPVMYGSQCGESVVRNGSSCGIRFGNSCRPRIGSSCTPRIGHACLPRVGPSCISRLGAPCGNRLGSACRPIQDEPLPPTEQT